MYNADGNLTRETLPDGHQTNYAYTNLGLLVVDTDCWFDILNFHAYDNFGRETQSIRWSGSGTFEPDTTTVTISANGDMQSAYCVTTTSTYSPTTTEYYDGLGRNVASGTVHFDGREFVKQRSYDNAGMVTFESLPHLKGTTTDNGTYYTYDSFHRVASVAEPGGKTVQSAYFDGYTEVTENGNTTTLIYDTDGRLVTKTDDNGDIMYLYNALGDYSKIKLYYMSGDEVTVSYSYDKYGRLTSLTDPNGTTRRWTYNTQGWVSSYKFGTATTLFYYNAYGDVTRKSYKPRDTGKICRYIYDSKRQLTTVNGPDYHETYSYDSAGRLISKSRSVTADNIHTKGTTYTYNGENQIASIQSNVSTTQPLVETYSYRNGWLTDIDFNGKNVWHLAGEGTFGNTTSTSSWLSNTYYLRDNNGRIQTKYDYIRNSANGTTVTPHQYTYDIHGRIASKDGKAYGYDSFNQLTSWNGNNYSYDELGNITKSGGQGSISYNGYQLQSVAAPDTAVWGKGNLHMQNNGHNMPYCITLKKRNGDCISRMNFNYDAEGRRLYAKKENYLTQPTIVNHENIEPEMQFDYNRIYLDDRFEFIDKRSPASTGYLYIGGDTRTACAVAEINQNNVKLWQIFRDEQGSITAMSDSANIRRFYYDPWGRYCDASGNMSDSIYANGGNAGIPFYRGFLGQEHYLDFGLVNLNARLYSPFQGRFLANDPVFDPSVSILRFNPYIYANNCPSMYADPEGRFAWILAGVALAGGIMNVADNWGRIDNVWQGIGCFAIGAASGVGYYYMSRVPVGLIQGIAGGASTGGLMEGLRCGLNNMVFGESFVEGFWEGAPRGMMYGALFGGITGFVNAKLYDCNWLNGKPMNSSYARAEKIFRSYDVEGRTPQIEPLKPKETIVLSPEQARYKELVKEAQLKYPKKAGKIELHHVHPKYIIGYDDGIVVPIDAAYHQMITNEFRSLRGYGQEPLWIRSELEDLFNKVYSKYPLPPFN